MSFASFVFVPEFRSNANLAVESVRIENSSTGGNLVETSSRLTLGAVDGLESSALKGSLWTPLIGEGLGLGGSFPDSILLGLPRRIGAISGTTGFSLTVGAIYTPIIGGEAIVGGDAGRDLPSRFSVWWWAPYIWHGKRWLG